jgi:RNA polymerase sigma-70 factor (ECF subfamily)
VTIDRSEPELVARSKAGDHRAFAELLRAHDHRMRALVYRMTGSRQAMDDVLQDAYLKAYRSLPRFQGDASFATWLNRIVANTCIDHGRQRRRRPVVPLDEASMAVVDDEARADQRVPERSAINQALAGLPSDQRLAVLLVDGDGLTYDQAADLLGTRPGTVASRLSRARSTLRTRLGADREEGTR